MLGGPRYAQHAFTYILDANKSLKLLAVMDKTGSSKKEWEGGEEEEEKEEEEKKKKKKKKKKRCACTRYIGKRACRGTDLLFHTMVRVDTPTNLRPWEKAASTH
jgi:cobalamin-dependent methionine synthase I